MRPICANIIEESCLLSSSFRLETSNLFGAFCPCDRRAGMWWRPVYNLSSCLLHTRSLSLWHAVCLSSTLWHSQWDANVWNEDASMMSWCGLVDGRLYWWSEGHAEHVFFGAAFANSYWYVQSILGLVVCTPFSCIHSKRMCSQHQLISPTSARRVSLRAAVSCICRVLYQQELLQAVVCFTQHYPSACPHPISRLSNVLLLYFFFLFVFLWPLTGISLIAVY